jgi:predicted signal transduction protein with EAL and GGDEF domain
VATRITRAVRRGRGSDLVARIGADEFAVVTVPVFGTRGDAAAEAVGIAERLVEALSQPIEVEGYRVVTGASVGIALFPASGGSAEELLRNAGLAMRSAKAAGRGRHLFFEPEMGAEVHARRLLELDLRLALGAGAAHAFELRYAPVVDVLSGRAAVLEAVPCWQHPIHGELPAEILVPLATDLGLMVPLGRMLLRRACAELPRWPGPMRVALTVTAAELLDPRLEEMVTEALAASGSEAHRLELQLSEAELMLAPEPALEVLHRLRALGVRVTLDGFAATADVLAHLRAFPFDKLRINRSFARELAGRGAGAEVPRAVVGLCGRLGIPAAAEGVETEEQLRSLAVERCLQATGPLFGPAVAPSDVPAMLARLEVGAAAARGIRLPEMPAGE